MLRCFSSKRTYTCILVSSAITLRGVFQTLGLFVYNKMLKFVRESVALIYEFFTSRLHWVEASVCRRTESLVFSHVSFLPKVRPVPFLLGERLSRWRASLEQLLPRHLHRLPCVPRLLPSSRFLRVPLPPLMALRSMPDPVFV